MKRMLTIAAALLLAACSMQSQGGGPKRIAYGEDSLLARKANLVKTMENRMRVVLGESVRRFEKINRNFQDEIDSLEIPFVLDAVELSLKFLYEKEEELYKEAVGKITENHLREIQDVLNYLIPENGKVWEIAFDIVGSEDIGTSYDTRTGIKDIDEIANATIDRILLRSQRDEIKDDGNYLRMRRLRLARVFKHDIEGMGRFSVYASDTLFHHYSQREDGVACSVAFRREGLPQEVALELRQAVRHRVTRGGTTLYDSKFHWDRALGDLSGRLPLRQNIEDADYTVSTILMPRLNMDAPGFEDLNDYTAIKDYKTAVVESVSGKVLGSVSWQYVWHISHIGEVSVAKGSDFLFDAGSDEITRLLEDS